MIEQRLRNVCVALRTMPMEYRPYFSMASFLIVTRHGVCPSCAFAHYAARSDLQSAWRLDLEIGPVPNGPYSRTINVELWRAHFGITVEQLIELFGGRQYSILSTPEEVALHIEAFIEREKRGEKVRSADRRALCDGSEDQESASYRLDPPKGTGEVRQTPSALVQARTARWFEREIWNCIDTHFQAPNNQRSKEARQVDPSPQCIRPIPEPFDADRVFRAVGGRAEYSGCRSVQEDESVCS